MSDKIDAIFVYLKNDGHCIIIPVDILPKKYETIIDIKSFMKEAEVKCEDELSESSTKIYEMLLNDFTYNKECKLLSESNTMNKYYNNEKYNIVFFGVLMIN